MNQEFLDQIQLEGYRVWAVDGQWLLIDLVGEFVDSRHPDVDRLVRYCEQNVLTFGN